MSDAPYNDMRLNRIVPTSEQARALALWLVLGAGCIALAMVENPPVPMGLAIFVPILYAALSPSFQSLGRRSRERMWLAVRAISTPPEQLGIPADAAPSTRTTHLLLALACANGTACVAASLTARAYGVGNGFPDFDSVALYYRGIPMMLAFGLVTVPPFLTPFSVSSREGWVYLVAFATLFAALWL